MSAAEGPGGASRGRGPHRPSLPRTLFLVAAAAYALVAATTTAFTGSANLVTAIPIVGLAVLVLVRLAAPPAATPTSATGSSHRWRAWVVLFLVIVAWELAEYAARGSRADHPTLSSMLDAVDRHYALKASCSSSGCAWVPPSCARGGGATDSPEPRAVVSSALSYAVWAVLGLAMLALWAHSHAAGSQPARPAVVLERLARGPILRVVLVLSWMWAGWHLFAR